MPGNDEDSLRFSAHSLKQGCAACRMIKINEDRMAEILQFSAASLSSVT